MSIATALPPLAMALPALFCEVVAPCAKVPPYGLLWFPLPEVAPPRGRGVAEAEKMNRKARKKKVSRRMLVLRKDCMLVVVVSHDSKNSNNLYLE